MVTGARAVRWQNVQRSEVSPEKNQNWSSEKFGPEVPPPETIEGARQKFLSGGEPAALCVLDAVVRLLPGALSDHESASSDSHYDGLLSPPSYTRPPEYRGSRSPRSCARAITSRLRHGGRRRRSGSPESADPISGMQYEAMHEPRDIW
jgi:hypothetical protein